MITICECLCLEKILSFSPKTMNEKYGLNVFMRKKNHVFFSFFFSLVCFVLVQGKRLRSASRDGFCLSGAAAWALNIVGSLGDTSGSKTCISEV